MERMPSKPKVLYVEDNSIYLNLFNLIFTRYMDITTADKGSKALELLQTKAFDVIILDYELPDFNGLELLEIIQQKIPDLPVIIFTGEGDEEIARAAFKLGAFDYFVKKIDDSAQQQSLINSIQKAIEKTNAAKELKAYQDKLEQMVYERTLELEEVNNLLKNEIERRKQAEIELYKYTSALKDAVEIQNIELLKTNRQLQSEIAEKKQAESKLKTRNLQMKIVSKIMMTANKAENIKHLLDEITRYLKNLLGLGGICICLCDNSRTGNTKVASSCPKSYDESSKICDKVLSSESIETLFKDKLSGFKHTKTIEKDSVILIKEDNTAITCVPIKIKDSIIGIMCASFNWEDSFSPQQKKLLLEIAKTTGDAVYQMRVDEELSQSRRNLKALFDTIEDYIFVLDKDTFCLLDYNRAFQVGLGYSTEELKNISIFDIHPHKRFFEVESLVEALQDGIEMRCSIPFVSKNKVEIPVETNLTIGIHNGKIAVIGVSRDISERKRMESALRESEEKFRLISEMTSDFAYSFVVDPDFSYYCDWVTQGFFYTTGYDYKDLKRENDWFELIHPDDLHKIAVTIKDLLKGSIVKTDFRIITKDGSICWVADISKGVWDEEENRVTRVLGAARDITEQMNAQEALKESEDRYALAVKGGRVGVWDWNIKEKKFFIDSGLKALLNYKEKDLADYPGKILQMIHPHDKAKVMRNAVKHLKRVEPQFESEFRIRKKDGSLIHAYARGFAHRDSKGKAYRLVGSLTDITDRKTAELRLMEKNKELIDFVYVVSHDLKNPLNLIIGFLGLIKEEPSLFDEYFDRIVNQAQKLKCFIDNLLQLSRAGRVIEEKILLNPQELIHAAFVTGKPWDVSAELVFASPIPAIMGDPERLEQVFGNLIQNSIRFRDPDKEKLIIEAGCSCEGDYLLLYLQDNGMGIKSEILKLIFNAGFTRNTPDGTGFGLPIVRKIVEAHGGKIWASSAGEKHGARFYMLMPRS